jgi:phage terminase small subunit
VPTLRDRRLTPKQQQFVEEYLVDLNATQASIRAGYSRRTAEWIGPQLLGKTHVQAAVQAAMSARAARTEVTQDRVVTELARVAFGDARKVMTWGPDGLTLKASSELTDEEAAFVAEVSETTTEHGGSLKLKTNDKLKALELLGRHLGMFKEKVEVTGRDGEPLAPVIYIPANGRDG